MTKFLSKNIVSISIWLVFIFYGFFTFYGLKNEIKFLKELIEVERASYDHCIQITNERYKNIVEYYKNILDSLPLGSPLDTLQVSSNFGVRKHPITNSWRWHPGTDFLADWRDTIYATGHGIIKKSRYNHGYGRNIVIEHIGGYESRYAHLSRYFVKEGDTVVKNQPIGTAGNSGNVSGYHLHYEISRYNKVTDPVVYLKVKATMYHPVESQCDESPLITADGSKIDPHKVSNWNWIAISQDMLLKNGGVFNYGDKVYIKGTHKDGIYTIHDCMNKRITFKIDFLENIGTKQYRYDDVLLVRIPQENLAI